MILNNFEGKVEFYLDWDKSLRRVCHSERNAVERGIWA